MGFSGEDLFSFMQTFTLGILATSKSQLDAPVVGSGRIVRNLSYCLLSCWAVLPENFGKIPIKYSFQMQDFHYQVVACVSDFKATMKNMIPLAFAVLCTSVSSGFSLDEIAAYKAEDVIESSSGLVWHDASGIYNLEAKDPAGISIGEKPDIGKDGKSVVFSGEQVQPFRSLQSVDVPTGGLKVSLAFKPSSSAASAEQTLIRQGNWELRYSPEKEQIVLIVWHDEKSYTHLSASIAPEVWQEVVGTYEEGMMKLEVNGEAKTREAKGSLGTHHPTSAIFIGASVGSRASGVEFRPLCGALADIKLFVE